MEWHQKGIEVKGYFVLMTEDTTVCLLLERADDVGGSTEQMLEQSLLVGEKEYDTSNK